MKSSYVGDVDQVKECESVAERERERLTVARSEVKRQEQQDETMTRVVGCLDVQSRGRIRGKEALDGGACLPGAEMVYLGHRRR